MVYLGGPRRRGGWLGRGIYLHDPPPGYRPPRFRLPLNDRRRKAREDWILMRVTTVILVLTAAAFMVMIFLIIATHI